VYEPAEAPYGIIACEPGGLSTQSGSGDTPQVTTDKTDKRIRRAARLCECGVPYQTWARQKLIETTSGSVIDYDRIRNRINELGQPFRIREIAVAPWNSTQLTLQL
jgi:hypothetical protein